MTTAPWPQALSAATVAASNCPMWYKAHFRRGAALEGLNLLASAITAFSQ